MTLFTDDVENVYGKILISPCEEIINHITTCKKCHEWLQYINGSKIMIYNASYNTKQYSKESLEGYNPKGVLKIPPSEK